MELFIGLLCFVLQSLYELRNKGMVAVVVVDIMWPCKKQRKPERATRRKQKSNLQRTHISTSPLVYVYVCFNIYAQRVVNSRWFCWNLVCISCT